MTPVAHTNAMTIGSGGLRLLEGTRAYLYAVIDNFSRRVLAWRVAETFGPGNSVAVLRDATRGATRSAYMPVVAADEGVENVNAEVDRLRVSPRAIPLQDRPPQRADFQIDRLRFGAVCQPPSLIALERHQSAEGRDTVGRVEVQPLVFQRPPPASIMEFDNRTSVNASKRRSRAV